MSQILNVNMNASVNSNTSKNVGENQGMKNKKELLHYYPLANSQLPNVYNLQFFNDEEIDNIVRRMNLCNPLLFGQDEMCYRELSCIIINSIPMYYRKKTFYEQQIMDGLMVRTILEPIDESMFPKLSKYERSEGRKITLYKMKSINILVLTYSPNSHTICAELKYHNYKIQEFNKFISVLREIKSESS